MTQYRLISFKACPWVQRAAIVLREKKADFEFVHITTDNRPDWFRKISPHGKVPVLQLDEETALFESNAIIEYLDEVIEPRLHPHDPVLRAINRAWADYLPGFSAAIGAVSGASTEEGLKEAVNALRLVFERLETALRAHGYKEEQGQDAGHGPYFNGADYALVDASYAPFLQRYLIVEEGLDEALIPHFPALHRWAQALVARESTHSFPSEEFRSLYISALGRRGGLIGQRIAGY